MTAATAERAANGNSTVDLLLIARLLPLRNLVESSCVAAENSRLVFVAETRVFLHLFNLVQDIFRPDLVRKVAGKKKMRVSRAPNLIVQPLLTTLTADENIIVLEILAGFLLHRWALVSALDIQLAEIVMRTIHSVHPESRPGRAPFKETDSQPRKFIEYPVIDHTRERDDQRKRMTEAMDRHESLKAVESHAVMTAAVNGKRATQFLGFRIDWPVGPMSEVERQTAGRQHRPGHAKLLDRAAQLVDRLAHVLHRKKRHALETRAALHVTVVNPVIVSARHHARPIRMNDIAHGESDRGI